MHIDFYRSRDYIKRWRQENPDKIREYQRKSRQKERHRKHDLMEYNPEQYMFNQVSTRAKYQGIDFNIEISDIVIPETCPLLGCLIFFDPDNPAHPNTPSLDRIDNSKGYVKGNVWVISNKANTMKNSASIDQLKTFSENILRYFSQQ